MRFKTLANLALAASAAAMITGCADDSPRQLYYWDGSYTSSVYEYLTEEGDVNAQIAALEESVQKAYQKAAKVPPGLHAHLGLLYLSQGDGAQFRANVEKEAQLYPESRDYALFLLNQNGKAAVNSATKNSGVKDAEAGKFDGDPGGGKFDAKGSNLNGEAGSKKGGEFDASGSNPGSNLSKSADENLKQEPVKFKAGTNEISSDSSNLSDRTKNAKVGKFDAKTASETSKTAKRSQK